MFIKRAHLGILAAILLAGAAGFMIARAISPGSVVEREHAEGEHADEEHAEGVVALNEADAAASGVQIVNVERGSGLDLLLPGRVSLAVGASSIVSSPLDGTIVQLFVTTGSKVARGTAVGSVRSPEGGAIRADVDAARAELDAAEALDARNRKLFDEGGISRQEWEATRASTLKAEANLRAAQAQANAMGSPDLMGLTVIRSPIAGVVTRVATTPGSVLDDGMEIVTVADETQTELVLEAPPASASLVKVGNSVAVQWTGGPQFEAEIVGVAPGLNGAWATVRAKANGESPPLGTVVSGRLLGGAGNSLTVPSEAVQRINGVASVFVLGDKGFRAVSVTTGRTSNSRTEVISGLMGDERIAGTGAFLLKAELGKSEAGHED